MTRTLSFSALALLALPSLAFAQSTTTACGTETWSTDRMAYVGVPCADGPAATQQQAVVTTGAQYCAALVARYDAYVNKGGKRGGMQSTNNAGNVAAAKCRAGDASGIADLERALKDARVALPPRG